MLQSTYTMYQEYVQKYIIGQICTIMIPIRRIIMRTIHRITKGVAGKTAAFAAAFVMALTLVVPGSVSVNAMDTTAAKSAGDTIATAGNAKFVASQALEVTSYTTEAAVIGENSYTSALKSTNKNNSKVGSSNARAFGYVTATADTNVVVSMKVGKDKTAYVFESASDLNLSNTSSYSFTAADAKQTLSAGLQDVNITVSAGKYYYIVGVGTNLEIMDFREGTSTNTGAQGGNDDSGNKDNTTTQTPAVEGQYTATSGAIDSYFALNGKAEDDTSGSGTKTYSIDGNPVKSTGRIKLGAKGTANSISFTVSADKTATVEVWALSASSAAKTEIALYDSSDSAVKTATVEGTQTISTYDKSDSSTEYGKAASPIELTLTAEVTSGSYKIATPDSSAGGSANIYYIRVTEKSTSTSNDDSKEENAGNNEGGDNAGNNESGDNTGNNESGDNAGDEILDKVWQTVDGKQYWYENGVKQGTEGRGKEIYDSASDAWYFLDAAQGGVKATSKDLYQESLAGDWGDVDNGDGTRSGKWVRYDANGYMIKGWCTGKDDTARTISSPSEAGDEAVYYFDKTYGTMAKGYATIDNVEYYFNTTTGILEKTLGETPEQGWNNVEGIDVWYEGHIRQGYSVDSSYRGKEIWDPDTDGWYWLDNVDGGKKAVSKDVYQESQADDAGTIGKWVRYDSEGIMIKGWSAGYGETARQISSLDEANGEAVYYFDWTYGTMAKGTVTIDGVEYTFDTATGVLVQ
jgi:hypothetical protein